MPTALGKITVDQQTLSRFIRLPLDALQDPALSPTSLKALAILIWYSFHGGRYPGHAAAAADFTWSERSLCRALAALEQTGWARLTPAGPGATATIQIPDPQRRLPLDATSGVPERHFRRPMHATSGVPCTPLPASSLRPCLDLQQEDPTTWQFWYFPLARHVAAHNDPPARAALHARTDANQADNAPTAVAAAITAHRPILEALCPSAPPATPAGWPPAAESTADRPAPQPAGTAPTFPHPGGPA